MAFFWAPRFSPQTLISQVSPQQMQEALESLFRVKGLPKVLRLDNGWPFANQRDRFVPTDLALWLVSLDVLPVFNPPHSPQKNGVVECMQRVSFNWSGPKDCPDRYALQQKLDEVAYYHLHEHRLRRLNDQTRAQAFPELLSVPRPFDQATINPQRVRNYLARIVIQREVSDRGIVGFAKGEWSVGRKHRRKKVTISFNPHIDRWEIKDSYGTVLRQLPKTDLSPSAIVGLTVMSMNADVPNGQD